MNEFTDIKKRYSIKLENLNTITLYFNVKKT